MKVREVRIRGFRNFQSTTQIRFTSDLTGEVRPITVLAGSNGSGKTTVLRVILAGMQSMLEQSNDLRRELRGGGGVALMLQMSEGEGRPSTSDELPIALGAEAAALAADAPELQPWIYQGAVWRDLGGTFSTPWDRVRLWVESMERDEAPIRGGALFFPHGRWFETPQQGPIEPPPAHREWIWEYDPKQTWSGSLAHQWVWQNYLDLEQQREGRPNLAPFVETIETVLGAGRKLLIRQGRVHISHPDGRLVEPHQLPSGEQQILTLFGELARQLRPGAIVLIDEIELSLHPALLRAVFSHLLRVAARLDLQFIVTTHSMDLVSLAGPDLVVNLDDLGAIGGGS